MLTIIGNNCAGLKAKLFSFRNLVNVQKPAVVMVQETKLYRKGTIQLENFCIFEKLRDNNEGGGLMTIIHENLQPALIQTQNSSKMSVNVLVVEATLRKSKVRFINSYGIQETSTVEDKVDFYSTLEDEIQSTFDAGCMLCWETDANAKLGPEYIKGDPHEITNNGKLLLNLVERYNLVIVNGTEKCSGVITRMRKKGKDIEKSAIDFFIVCQALFQMVTQMQIDEDRNMVLTKFYKNRGQTVVTESDHNPLVLELDISWNTKIIQKRTEVYNL